MSLSPILTLDVGGKVFRVARETIMKFPTSTISLVITGKDVQNMIIVEGAYFFDRNPDYFTILLDFLRHGKLFWNPNLNRDQLLEEAKFWRIQLPNDVFKGENGVRNEQKNIPPAQEPIVELPKQVIVEERFEPTLVMNDRIEPTLMMPQDYEPTLILHNEPGPKKLEYEPTLLMNTETIESTLIFPQNMPEPTLLIQDQMPEPTLIMQNQLPEPTLLMDNNVQPTLVLTEPPKISKENPIPPLKTSASIKSGSSSSLPTASLPISNSDDILSSLMNEEEEKKVPARALPWGNNKGKASQPAKKAAPKIQKKSKAEIEEELYGSHNLEEDYESSFIDDSDEEENLDFSDEDVAPKKRKRTPAKKKPAKKDSAANKCKKTKILSAADLSKAMEEEEEEGTGRKTRQTVAKTLPSILISGINAQEKKKLETMVKTLGGKIVNQFSENPTHLVMEKFLRTLKLLEALNRGIDIISIEWIKESALLGEWDQHEKYLLCTPEVEAEHKFNYKESLRRSQEQKVLDGWDVWISPNIQPSKNDIQELVESAGGRVLKKEPDAPRGNVLILSSAENKDKRSNQIMKQQGFKIYTKELLLESVLKQELAFKDEFLIK
ncbi:unnamed protein product [Blepharisma stoltei]|uniref:BRCT domain-containing protein n=1 Tax=Blepharisma stoltei TaxID=1481888 RepID=A0AAU9IT63_9CILI|nr:unnamed protein product [Blepharisma stoltei]